MTRSLPVTVLLAAGLCFPAAADEPVSVTTDTAGYCLMLANRLERDGDMPALARALWLQGRSMCEHGQVRSGLARLRRAIMIVRGGDNH